METVHVIAVKDKPNVPCGTILMMRTNYPFQIMNGFLPCEGQPVSKDKYPELFKVIGTNWGGSASTFNLPNLKAKLVKAGYEDWWEIWPCHNCKRIFSDGHDRVNFTCPKQEYPDWNTYEPMDNFEYVNFIQEKKRGVDSRL